MKILKKDLKTLSNDDFVDICMDNLFKVFLEDGEAEQFNNLIILKEHNTELFEACVHSMFDMNFQIRIEEMVANGTATLEMIDDKINGFLQ